MSEKKQPVDLGLLEEDDEFEEFPAEDWAGLDEDEDAHVWEDNWDDDNVEDDFSNQLRSVDYRSTEDRTELSTLNLAFQDQEKTNPL
ncbi:26S proteasome complex subunit SEM1 isoform X1 [Tenrec ecaudatus]|uniref:26S proteasome complex subunit SEM1 isoform X1 n=1 Tax=Tenrec ecaudatus TaxID=94439 RepID=UPI003F59B01E